MTTIDRSAIGAGERLLTVEDLCAYLVVSKDYVYEEVRQGRLRAVRITRQLRFKPTDVEAFLESNTVNGSEF